MGWVDGSTTGTQNEHGSKKPVLLEGIQESIMASYDWSVPVNSLLLKMQEVGFTITAVNNGEETIKINQQQSNLAIRKAAVEEVVSVDEATVFIKKDNKSARLYLVLGNEPDELLCDYTEHPLIEAANDKYILQWEGKKCPMIED